MWWQNIGSICFVSSQSTRVTDGQTDRRTDEQNYDPQDRAIAASRGNSGIFIKYVCPYIPEKRNEACIVQIYAVGELLVSKRCILCKLNNNYNVRTVTSLMQKYKFYLFWKDRYFA